MAVVDEFEDLLEEYEPTSLVVSANSTDKEIEKQFETGRLRVVQDRNDLYLSHVVDFIETRKWGNLRPEYQRRLRWDDTKKSRLIESFLMNVPVPPVFLFQKGVGSFEVMDGQQRLNTIVEFLQGRFDLTGLKIWKSLNGKRFKTLPPLIQKGLESAKISAITLMSDLAMSDPDNMDLRAQVFERLNTGGEPLNPQELRNSLYSGSFNRLLLELAKLRDFTDAWGIPPHSEHILSDDTPSQELRDNILFRKMHDVEIVLRFFAFLDKSKISGSVRAMLDNTMKTFRHADERQIQDFRFLFERSLSTSIKVFGKDAFRLPSTRKGLGNLSRPLFDAEMIAFNRLHDREEQILRRRADVKQAVFKLATPDSESYDLVVGRANTANTIKERIDTVEKAILGAL